MKTIVIADNLVNDYCGQDQKYIQKHVHIGVKEVEKLFGDLHLQKIGALTEFIIEQSLTETKFLFFRDYYEEDKQIDNEHLERLGEHCLANNEGSDIVEGVKEIAEQHPLFNCTGISFPVHQFRSFLQDNFDIDIFSNSYPKESLRFLIVGFHTERRVYNIANTLRNIFGFPEVAVFSHFVAGLTQESHYTALRYTFPDSLIQVLNSVDELQNYLGHDLNYLNKHVLSTVSIQPQEVLEKLGSNQRKIMESICMHWTEVNLKPLSGGFSGSLLFIAEGKQGKSRTEPMVIKVDTHTPIRNEINGYNLVKNFLGKHVPTFTFPVSVGNLSGIGMELASMEGSPQTLQNYFEIATDDYSFDHFLKLLKYSISLLSERVYRNTKTKRNIAPFRHFKLHVSQQSNWLSANIENLSRHKTDKIMVMKDVVLNIFNLIRVNNDSILSDVCISHGDLNFANIIVDKKENFWTIDWTHANLHPIEIDFTKMENDLKFVLSKELQYEDLPNLKLFEDFILENLVPESINKIPSHLSFIKWDFRFKKIYKSIRLLRQAYRDLKSNDEWLIYKIGLLSYALHTLSFDKTLDAGECSPAQLFYSYITIEALCFLLMADDYHLKIRSEKPEEYPERQRIQIDYSNWKISYNEYDPPYYVSNEILENTKLNSIDKFADPEDKWDFSSIVSWQTPFTRSENNKPLNPRGRTGISGRGLFGIWGSNPMLFLIPIRYNVDEANLEVLVHSLEKESELINIHIRRGEKTSQSILRAQNKAGIESNNYDPIELHKGYLYDPRQTDNAWADAMSYLLFEKNDSPNLVSSKTSINVWKIVSPSLINDLSSSHSYILREAIKYIKDSGLVTEKFIARILDKTG